MIVPVRIQLGISGRRVLINPIQLDVDSIDATSSWAGSYHVLAMGSHFDAYVVTGKLPGLPPIAGIPAAHPYEAITGKTRASAVTGNIGEATAALFACRYLNAAIGNIAHIRPRRPFRRRKAPDYMMRLGALMPGPFTPIVPTAFAFKSPEWWPVESKARGAQAASNAGRREALGQLAVYWSLLTQTQPALVGYGLITVLQYQLPRELRASLIIPKNQPALIAGLQQKGWDIDDPTLRTCLYGC